MPSFSPIVLVRQPEKPFDKEVKQGDGIIQQAPAVSTGDEQTPNKSCFH